MRRLCDLHVHSTASDGSLAPAEVIALADRQRLAGVALTDHDTVAGLAEAAQAAKAFPELAFVPGIEVSAAWPQGTLHILGLGFDPASSALAALARRLREERNRRNPLMVGRLRSLGLEVTMEEVASEAAASPAARGEEVVGRAHMAAVLARKGFARGTKDAFDRYLAKGAPAYVEKDRLPPAEVFAAIRAAGGLAVLAHPVQLRFTNFAECERLVRGFKEAGLEGIEVHHGDHDVAQSRFFLELARRLDLVPTGGSDFHGAPKPDVRLGRPRVPVQFLHELRARLPR